MAELEFGGLKFSGGKMVAVLTALSTLHYPLLVVLPGADLKSIKIIWI